jgi:uncharacterized protein YecE (DUF72 family)
MVCFLLFWSVMEPSRNNSSQARTNQRPTTEKARFQHATLPVPEIFIGTAGWTLPTHLKKDFPQEGTHLERYAQIFNCVEINSSFYRDHRPETYARWAQSVPPTFRFSVKLSRYFTQETRLEEAGERLSETLAGPACLGPKWGCLLVQLPPSLPFRPGVAARFIDELREYYEGLIVWEPRHPSWVSSEALTLLRENQIHKVWADPEPCPLPTTASNRHHRANYFRLHGSPQIYKSRYTESDLAKIMNMVEESHLVYPQTWCIFDNTTYGFATENAQELMHRMQVISTQAPSQHQRAK